MTEFSNSEVYKAIGSDGFMRLCAAFYRRVSADDILGPMYPEEDMTGAESRLRDFLIYRFGGPDDYIKQRGHPRLRARHAPFPVDENSRNRWVKLMGEAIVEAELPPDVAAELNAFFGQVATFLINRQMPIVKP